MTLLLELRDQLRDTGAAIATHEKAVAHSDSPSIAASLRSLKKRLTRLETEFTTTAQNLGVDVCSYRLFSEVESQSLPAISVFSTVEAFQTAFSVVYDATKRGPRTKAAVTPESKKESEFQFGYVFSGSLGIVMTMSNEQMLVETALDQSMDAMFNMAQSKNADEVLIQSRTLGAAVVKAMHNWASSHVQAGLGVDIKWIRGSSEKARLLLQVPELESLKMTLADATEDVEETVTLLGELVGIETQSSRRFHFMSDDEGEIRGPYLPSAISVDRPASSPARYNATFQRKGKRLMTTDEFESLSYVLTKLDPVS